MRHRWRSTALLGRPLQSVAPNLLWRRLEGHNRNGVWLECTGCLCWLNPSSFHPMSTAVVSSTLAETNVRVTQGSVPWPLSCSGLLTECGCQSLFHPRFSSCDSRLGQTPIKKPADASSPSPTVNGAEMIVDGITEQKKGPIKKLILYKGRWMVPFYVLVRLKVFQLMGFGSLAIPINTWLAEGNVSPIVALLTFSVVFGSGVASTALWYYSRRYVGELALLGKKHDSLQLSVMDFWGNREDIVVKTEALVPPLLGLSPQALHLMAQQAFIPMDILERRQFFLSLRYGHIINKKELMDLLNGRIMELCQEEEETHGA